MRSRNDNDFSGQYPGVVNGLTKMPDNTVIDGEVIAFDDDGRPSFMYEPGLRTGAWMKMRVNRGQEFVVGGYTGGTKTFDALVFGYYEADKLIYVARTRNGFTPATRA